MDGRISLVYENIEKILSACIKRGDKGYIIVGYDYYGMMIEEMLERCYDICPKAIVDDSLCEFNSKIVGFDEMIRTVRSGETIILSKGGWKERIKIQKMAPNVNVVSIMEPPIALRRGKGIEIGKYSYGPLLYEPESLWTIKSIGSFCSFAVGCRVVPDHPLDRVSTSRVMVIGAEGWWPELDGMPKVGIGAQSAIGNDVWFGANVIVKAGVSIGDGVVAGAGAVITKDVPDYAVVVGIPAHIIKYRFSRKQIDSLKKIQWWNWPIEKILENWDDFADINVFLERHSCEE